LTNGFYFTIFAEKTIKNITYFRIYPFTINKLIMQTDKIRYSKEELKEFQVLIEEKLATAREELTTLQGSILRNHGEANRSSKGVEDGAQAFEKEQLNQLAARTRRFIQDLDAALFRVHNGTYGICKDTHVLIPKARLRAVPHTQQSIEAKMNRDRNI
jgi:RNA polymerase-binding transcription factor DksA